VFDLDGYLTHCCLADQTDDQPSYAIDPLVVDSNARPWRVKQTKQN
jgi:hypothetical protein